MIHARSSPTRTVRREYLVDHVHRDVVAVPLDTYLRSNAPRVPARNPRELHDALLDVIAELRHRPRRPLVPPALRDVAVWTDASSKASPGRVVVVDHERTSVAPRH